LQRGRIERFDPFALLLRIVVAADFHPNLARQFRDIGFYEPPQFRLSCSSSRSLASTFTQIALMLRDLRI
jgi:hypothetical protein